MLLLRIWLLGTAALLVGLAVWAFAPLLVFAALVTGALGAASALMIALAGALRAWRKRRGRDARKLTAAPKDRAGDRNQGWR